jgi:hypothetical protein
MDQCDLCSKKVPSEGSNGIKKFEGPTTEQKIMRQSDSMRLAVDVTVVSSVCSITVNRYKVEIMCGGNFDALVTNYQSGIANDR